MSTKLAEIARRNGSKSRGPVTAAGRAISCMNSLQHGCLAQSPVIRGESREDWERHLDEVTDDLRPVGPVERELVGAVALILWKRHRLTRYEVAATARTRARFRSMAMTDLETLPEDVLPLAVLPSDGFMNKILRYASHLSRELARNLRMLGDLQAARTGGKVNCTLHRVIVEQRDRSASRGPAALELLNEPALSNREGD